MRVLLAATVLLATTSARAEVPRCAEGAADLAYDATDLPDLAADSGWFPSDSDVQVRITGQIIGETHVAMGLAPVACWDAAGNMTVTAHARLGTGSLSSQYGADVHLYGQIHTSVLGYAIDWSGEIPVPYVGDLLLAGQATFDPILLPDSPRTWISESDVTNPLTLLSTNLLSAIIDITGISGGLDLNVQGAMTTTYWTTSLSLAGGDTSSASGKLPVEGPFGATLPVPVSAQGVVRYDPSLVFSIAFDVHILGVKVVNWALVDVALPLPSIERPVTLAAADLALPLPRLGNVPAALGFAAGGSQPLHVTNTGAGPLAIALVSAPPGVSVAPVTIAPGGEGDVTVVATDLAQLASSPLVLETNDPAHGSLSIALSSTADGQTDEDPVGHAGCSAGGTASPFVAIVLAMILRKRRKLLPIVLVAACGGGKDAPSADKKAPADDKVASCNSPKIGSCREYRGGNLALGTDSLEKLCKAASETIGAATFKAEPCPTAKVTGTCTKPEGKDFYYDNYPIPAADNEKQCKDGGGTFGK